MPGRTTAKTASTGGSSRTRSGSRSGARASHAERASAPGDGIAACDLSAVLRRRESVASVKVMFPSEIHLQHMYGADPNVEANQMATATDEIVATSVTAVLGTMIPVGNTFQIMGTSATQMHPGRVALACINIEGPPPSPPHPATCDLGVAYSTKSVYE
eukprot:5412017-Prymnesium_polylepis.1